MSLALAAALIASLCPAQTPAPAVSRPAAATSAPTPPQSPSAAVDTSTQVTEGIVNAPVSELWAVFSTSEGFKKLGVAKAEIDFRVGGLMRSHYNPEGVIGDEGTIQNEILAFEPQRMLAFRIHTPPKGFPFKDAWKNTWTVVTLTDLGDDRTSVRLTGVGYDATEESQEMREFFRAGNAYVMQVLQSKFDDGVAVRAGSAHVAGPLEAIEAQQLVAAPRAEVYRLYTTSDGWKKFVGADTRIKLMPGGPWEVFFNPAAPQGQRGSEGCTVLSYVPNEMVSYTWNAPPTQAYTRTKHTWVVVTFEEVGPALTRVRINHQGFAQNNADEPGHEADWIATRAYFTKAWPGVLSHLANYCKSKS